MVRPLPAMAAAILVSLTLALNGALPAVAQSGSSAQQPTQPPLTVLVEGADEAQPGDATAQSILGRFREDLGSTGQFKLADARGVDAVLLEMGRADRKCADDACVLTVAQRLNAHRAVAVRLVRAGDGNWHLSAVLRDVDAGLAAQPLAASLSGDTFTMLTSGAAHVARDLAGIRPDPVMAARYAPTPEPPAPAESSGISPWWWALGGGAVIAVALASSGGKSGGGSGGGGKPSTAPVTASW